MRSRSVQLQSVVLTDNFNIHHVIIRRILPTWENPAKNLKLIFPTTHFIPSMLNYDTTNHN
jgi:hypothetical protein